MNHEILPHSIVQYAEVLNVIEIVLDIDECVVDTVHHVHPSLCVLEGHRYGERFIFISLRLFNGTHTSLWILNSTEFSAGCICRAIVKAKSNNMVEVLLVRAQAEVAIILPRTSITVWDGLALCHARVPELTIVAFAGLFSGEPVASRNLKAERSFIVSG